MKLKKTKTLFILLVLIFILTLLLVFLFRPSKTDKYIVEKKKKIYSVYASGFIDSSDSVTIKSEVSGHIQKIIVKEGEEVKKGQLLLIISNETLKENLRDIESQLASVEDRLMPDSDFKKEFLNAIEIKRAVLENVEKNFNRRKTLYEEELISREKFDEIKREYEIAKRDYERQINQYKDTIKNLNYQLESLKAKKQFLNAEIDKYYIKSPINGKILRKFVNEGDYVNPLQQSNVLFSVGNEKNLETVLLVDEEYIPMVKPGMKVYITLDSYPGETFEGNVKTIEGQSDRNTRTVKIKADVNYRKPVFFGLTVEANIIIRELEGIFIPEIAYRQGYVEVLEGGKIKKLKVKVSPEKYNGYINVLEGLREGQEVIIK